MLLKHRKLNEIGQLLSIASIESFWTFNSAGIIPNVV